LTRLVDRAWRVRQHVAADLVRNEVAARRRVAWEELLGLPLPGLHALHAAALRPDQVHPATLRRAECDSPS
jgi:hypothetical protein